MGKAVKKHDVRTRRLGFASDDDDSQVLTRRFDGKALRFQEGVAPFTERCPDFAPHVSPELDHQVSEVTWVDRWPACSRPSDEGGEGSAEPGSDTRSTGQGTGPTPVSMTAACLDRRRGPGAELRRGTVVNERYRIIGTVGRGGMGTVYEVEHLNTGERLALKLLHAALLDNEHTVERFRREARAPAHIGSDHVVRVVDADICEHLGDLPFIVMEFLKGRDLKGELELRGALPVGETVDYLRQVASALDRAHAKNIVHRDLKPANIYVERRDDGLTTVKVIDFGIAKLIDEATPALTRVGQLFGTPQYMAPEQTAGGREDVGPAADRWALGIIAYKLLTGMNYWTGDGLAELIRQVRYEAMVPPTVTAPHLGPLFDLWFSRACNRDPQQRFSSSEELVNELASVLGVPISRRGRSSYASFHPDGAQDGKRAGVASTQRLQSLNDNKRDGVALSLSEEGCDGAALVYQAPAVSNASKWLGLVLGAVCALIIGMTVIGLSLVSDDSSPVEAKWGTPLLVPPAALVDAIERGAANSE